MIREISAGESVGLILDDTGPTMQSYQIPMETLGISAFERSFDEATGPDVGALFSHASEEIAATIVPRITDRHLLVPVIQNYRRLPIGIAAKKRFLELLDAEYARMVGWEKFFYWLFRRDQERDI